MNADFDEHIQMATDPRQIARRLESMRSRIDELLPEWRAHRIRHGRLGEAYSEYLRCVLANHELIVAALRGLED